MPRLADHRGDLETLDQDAALVVHREVGGANHALAALGAQPCGDGVEQRDEHLGVLLELEEAKPPPAGVVLVVEGVVDLGADAPDDAPVAAREEVLGFAVGEVGVHAPVQEDVALELQRGHPQWVVSMQAVLQVDEPL